MIKITTRIFVLLFPLFLSATAQEKNEKTFTRGAGQFEYSAYQPLSNKPVTVFYYVPTSGDITKMKILFSMHGAERSGIIQRGVWRNIAEKHGFIVIAPQFTHKNGYLENDYQFGGVSKNKGQFELQAEEKWTYKVIEALFDYTKSKTGNISKTYDMFGHSAGGQFVHRYLLMTPEARISKALAANPGNYTYPNDTETYTLNDKIVDSSRWPFSLKETPFANRKRLASYFKKELFIVIGTADTASTTTIDKSPGADLAQTQGFNRHERALNYFAFCEATAKKNKMDFNWKLVEIPGAGHSSAQIIHGNPTIKSKKIENNESVYHLTDLKETGAYQILINK